MIAMSLSVCMREREGGWRETDRQRDRQTEREREMWKRSDQNHHPISTSFNSSPTRVVVPQFQNSARECVCPDACCASVCGGRRGGCVYVSVRACVCACVCFTFIEE